MRFAATLLVNIKKISRERDIQTDIGVADGASRAPQDERPERIRVADLPPRFRELTSVNVWILNRLKELVVALGNKRYFLIIACPISVVSHSNRARMIGIEATVSYKINIGSRVKVRLKYSIVHVSIMIVILEENKGHSDF